MIRSKYSSLIGMTIELILFFGIDKWLDWQARIAQKSSDYPTYFIWIIVSGLVICVLLCGLSWLTLIKSQRSFPISIIFIAVGLLVYNYPILYLWSSWLPLPYIFSYHTPLAYTGIFISVLGMMHLFLPE
jgi:hypothetical protein